MFTFIAMLIWFVIMSLEDEVQNNGDKFYRRKSMWAADEKLIMNELGTNYAAISLVPSLTQLNFCVFWSIDNYSESHLSKHCWDQGIFG